MGGLCWRLSPQIEAPRRSWIARRFNLSDLQGGCSFEVLNFDLEKVSHSQVDGRWTWDSLAKMSLRMPKIPRVPRVQLKRDGAQSLHEVLSKDTVPLRLEPQDED